MDNNSLFHVKIFHYSIKHPYNIIKYKEHRNVNWKGVIKHLSMYKKERINKDKDSFQAIPETSNKFNMIKINNGGYTTWLEKYHTKNNKFYVMRGDGNSATRCLCILVIFDNRSIEISTLKIEDIKKTTMEDIITLATEATNKLFPI